MSCHAGPFGRGDLLPEDDVSTRLPRKWEKHKFILKSVDNKYGINESHVLTQLKLNTSVIGKNNNNSMITN